jgi:hypothetical protein
MLDGGMGHNNGCKCRCHEDIDYYVKKIMETIKGENP